MQWNVSENNFGQCNAKRCNVTQSNVKRCGIGEYEVSSRGMYRQCKVGQCGSDFFNAASSLILRVIFSRNSVSGCLASGLYKIFMMLIASKISEYKKCRSRLVPACLRFKMSFFYSSTFLEAIVESALSS